MDLLREHWVTLVAAAAGVLVLFGAHRRRWLGAGGVSAAAFVGVGVVWGLGATALGLLLFFFVTSSALGRALDGSTGRPDEAAGRTAGQVLANAGVATLAAAAAAWLPGTAAWEAAFAGALAAATADTWASEVGEWRAAGTRLITTGRRVDPGVDGGVSWPGSVAACAGSLAVAALAVPAFGSSRVFWPVALAGVVGMLVDSLAGALIDGAHERVRNDAINWLATATGAAIGLLLG
jgi:uncharacterized protein (TIGR00297 family)